MPLTTLTESTLSGSSCVEGPHRRGPVAFPQQLNLVQIKVLLARRILRHAVQDAQVFFAMFEERHHLVDVLQRAPAVDAMIGSRVFAIRSRSGQLVIEQLAILTIS